MTQNSQTRKEAVLPTKLLSHKHRMLIGTWNVRTMYETGKAAQVAREMEIYDLDILGLSETRWVSHGRLVLNTGQTLIYSGLPNENDDHRDGVGIMLSRKATKSLIEWKPVSERIISARFAFKFQNVSVVQCYAPTNPTDRERKDEYYELLQSVLDKIPRRDILIVMGDMNAKVGSNNSGRERIMGKHGVGEINENGELFLDFCGMNDLVIGGTVFPHKNIHKTTWTSPDQETKNQIDHIAISRRWRRTLEDTKAKNGADVGSDHALLVGKLRVKIAAQKQRSQRNRRFNVEKLKQNETREEFSIALSNRFQALEGLDDASIEGKWKQVKECYTKVCEETLGFKKKQQKAWLSVDTWNLVEERKALKGKVDQARTRIQKKAAQQQYTEKNKQVKRSARKDKRTYIDSLALEAQQAAAKNDMKTLYSITKQLSGNKRGNTSKPVKDKAGNIITTEKEQLDRWQQHFAECLNKEAVKNLPDLPEGEDLEVKLEPISKIEIIQALQAMKSGKAPGPDDIPPEALKQNPQQSADILQSLLNKIWEEEIVPEDWKNGYIVKLPKKGDLSECQNWRGIQLLSIPSKVLMRVILERVRAAVDQKLRQEQAGFRQGKSCTDQIATLRIIVEQSVEWQSPLYLNFIDFEKAFDSLDRTAIWKLLRHYGIPLKITRIIQSFYHNMTCQVIHNNDLTQQFRVETGVRQGCLLSPLIFLLAIDWVMKESTIVPRGIQWTLGKKLEDLDFADDISLIANAYKQMQEKTNALERNAEKLGLKVNVSKTKVMRVNEKQDSAVTLNSVALEEVNHFTYLGSVVSKTGGTEEDIKSRINKARHAFVTLKPLWNAKNIILRTKMRIFNTNVKSVLLYGSETWRETVTLQKKLQVFINKCLRQILRIRWPETITNKQLWDKTQQKSILQDIKRRKWRWIGHTWRKDPDDITRQALDWNPQGKRKRGRPKNTWRRSSEQELRKNGISWSEGKQIAKDRQRWKVVVEDLCSAWNEED
jgi:hypothetical protein